MRLLLIILILIPVPFVLYSDGMNSPPGTSRQVRFSPEEHFYQTNNISFVLSGFIRVYSKVISPADGARSPSYPTGSAYGYQAVKKYGFFPGIFLTADRLLHESDIHRGPYILKYGKKRYYDPLYWNTFWWETGGK